MDYQWYPGHMTKARRRMQENLKLVDLIIELTDARCVLSGRNPDIDALAGQKNRILILTKADLADEKATAAWTEYFREKGIIAAAMDTRRSGGMKQIRQKIQLACADKIRRDRERGIKNRPVRAMVVGIPNVGKSTFINSLAGKASMKTGNRPGVTRGEQWIRPDRTLELLDTPGILWPKFEDQTVGLRLSLTGTIRDELLNREEMAQDLIHFLQKQYPDALERRYGIRREKDASSDSPDASRMLAEIADIRGVLGPGGTADTSRAADLLIDDFRSGKLGRISLEFPQTETAE